ncbi:MAG TPA: lipid II flippase MurJ [Bryobacteraceae bacterium]|nr:lipid II flippase MurJ [Bryobacteraceae bacterium]
MGTAQAAERRESHRRVFTNAAVVGVLATAAKLAGAAKVMVTARYFGAGDQLDAFVIAFLLPAFFTDIVAGSFGASFVPAFIRVRSHQGEAAARMFARTGLALVLGAMLAVTIVMAAGGRWILPWLGSSFSDDKLGMTISLFLVLILWMPMSACIAVWRSVLHAHNAFALAAAFPLTTPLATIVLLYAATDRWGIYVLCWGTLAGVAVETLFLAGAVRRLGIPILPAWRGWTPEMSAIRRQYVPLLAGSMLTALSPLIDQAVAGSLGSGTVSALAYGTKLASVLAALGATAIATAILPEFSRLAAALDWSHLRHTVRVHFAVIALLSLPIVAGTAWLSGPIVRTFFEGGAFDASATRIVTSVQQWSLLQVPFAILFVVAGRLAVAVSETTVLIRAALITVLATLAGDLLLARWVGIAGIPMAGVLAHALALSALVYGLYRREPRLFR